MNQLKLFCTTLLLISSITASAIAPVGKVFIYKKSNFDDSNEGNIAVYYRSANELESFKWRTSNNSATVVRAVIDPETLNVISFEAYRLRADGTKIPGAELTQINAKEVKGSMGEHSLELSIDGIKWHSYDFDFASLAYAYRFLKNKENGFTFDIVDIDFSQDKPELKRFGQVSMEYSATKMRDGKPVLEFTIDGPGLDNRGGMIWFDAETHTMTELKIKKPDESGYDSNKMQLVAHLDVKEEQWQAFKRNELNSGSR